MLHIRDVVVCGMWNRASHSILWPKLSEHLERKRAACQECNKIAPSQPALPPVPPPRPEYPMQQLCTDIAHFGGKTYIVIVDRYTNWPSVYPTDGANGVIKALRFHFITYGAAEEIASEYLAASTQEFLKRWKVAHRLSSAYYPQSNLRAELGVKVVKRMLRENIGTDGSLETDRFARALLSYRNTPGKETGLSPAQMLFGRRLRDHLPTMREELQQRREWLCTKEQREKALSEKYGKIEHDRKQHTKELGAIEIGSSVQVQNQRGNEPLRWEKSGVVVESMGNNQYAVKMDGSGRVTLRNRRFLRPIIPLFSKEVVYTDKTEEKSKSNQDVRRSGRCRVVVDRYQT